MVREIPCHVFRFVIILKIIAKGEVCKECTIFEENEYFEKREKKGGILP